MGVENAQLKNICDAAFLSGDDDLMSYWAPPTLTYLNVKMLESPAPVPRAMKPPDDRGWLVVTAPATSTMMANLYTDMYILLWGMECQSLANAHCVVFCTTGLFGRRRCLDEIVLIGDLQNSSLSLRDPLMIYVRVAEIPSSSRRAFRCVLLLFANQLISVPLKESEMSFYVSFIPIHGTEWVCERCLIVNSCKMQDGFWKVEIAILPSECLINWKALLIWTGSVAGGRRGPLRNYDFL